jgi:glycosyltransferase involved in cell wall biosynthesis
MMGPSIDSRGGIASVCAEYARSGIFDRLGVRFLPTFVDAGSAAKMGIALLALLRLLALLCARKVDIVHVHMASGSSVWRKALFCALASVFSRPYIVHLHSGKLPTYFDERCGPVRKWALRRLLLSSAHLIVITSERISWLRSVGVMSERVTLMPNPVGALPECPADPLRSEGAPRVVFLGRLEPAKGVDCLLEAFGQVTRRYPSARLILAGEGDAAGCMAQARVLNVERLVDCIGWVQGRQKAELLEGATILALPSLYEGQPMSVLEAMAYAVPCVTTNVGGLPDIVRDGETGFLVPVGDAERLANVLLDLLQHPELRARIGAHARAYVHSRHSAAAVQALLSCVYDGVIRDR